MNVYLNRTTNSFIIKKNPNFSTIFSEIRILLYYNFPNFSTISKVSLDDYVTRDPGKVKSVKSGVGAAFSENTHIYYIYIFSKRKRVISLSLKVSRFRLPMTQFTRRKKAKVLIFVEEFRPWCTEAVTVNYTVYIWDYVSKSIRYRSNMLRITHIFYIMKIKRY